ncbi:ABC transporter permease [Sporolactobacillus nakayamae]|uniref:ABC-2 type transport system permease protein n=1 Tax=Sporolactobacillus nakayamae TaxID=269670 RepID=A0A1I2TTJ0_9BACL|nr:ABC transporter permease [Sporolactobacillus nakayamae]SFG68093.1 ABC-2 type transport system permease protein [Sporolactobacillus nakayamae]
MFTHIFIYRFKCLIRDKQLVFWTLLFPILLGTFFYMAFSNLNNEETFQPIDAAVVNDSAYQHDTQFKSVMENVSKGKDRLFHLKVASNREEAEKWLKKDKIKGFFTSGEVIKLTVKDTGISQSIMKSFADQYRTSSSMVTSIVKENPKALQNGLLNDLGNHRTYVKEVTGGSAEPNNVLNYFYSLIAMACLYGSFWGMKEVTDIQADITDRAARVNMAPVHKLKAFLAGSCAALVILFVEILILLAYLRFGLNISFGNRAGFVVLTALVGSVLGVSFGAFISALVKKGEGLKIALLMVATMAGSFLSGMMFMNMKYLIAAYVPPLAWLNPVNLLTDAFYALYYYDSLHRYALNLGMMFLFIIFFCTGTYLIVRRRKYASI